MASKECETSMEKQSLTGASDGAPTNEPSENLTNLSVGEWSLQRLKSKTGKPVVEEQPKEPEVTEEAIDEKPEESPVVEDEQEGISETEEVTAESEVESVLSKLNLDDLSTEEVDQLRDALRSKALARYGELTAKRKAAEEKASQLERELQELKSNKNPLEAEKPVENNPFADIESVKDLQEQFQEFTKIQEWAEDVLDENEHSGYDDIVTEVDGKELTKRQVREYLKKARKAKETFLPARLKEIQDAQQREQVAKVLDEQIAKEISWYAEQDNDTRKQLDMVLEDAAIDKIRSKVPEIAPRLNYILAHAMNSIVQTKNKASGQPASSRVKPPSNPTGNVARGIERDGDKIKKQLNALQSRFESSGGSKEDFVALRAAQRRLRK